MLPDTDEIINFLSNLARDEQLKVTVSQSIRGGFIAGVSAAVGGLLGGPLGLAGGAALGGSVAAATSTKFLSVVEVIRNMQPDQKEHLAQGARQIMRNIGVSDVAALAGMVTGSVVLQNEVLDLLVGYLRNELHMVIADH